MLLHLQRRRPEVGPSLEQLISRCLSPKLDLRPQNAAELRTRLAEELEWVQRRMGPARDPHARLREFLKDADLGLPAGPGQASRLADAMMEMALAVPTHVGGSQSPAPSPEPDPGRDPERAGREGQSISLDSYDIEPFTTQDRGAGRTAEATAVRPASRTSHSRLRGRSPVLLVALGIVLLVAAGAILWWLSRVPSETSPPVVDSLAASSPTADSGEAPDAEAARPPDQAVATLDTASSPDSRRPDQTARSRPTPRPRRYGTLDLNASPWAEVYLGKRRLGNTPLQGVRLPAGRHRLRLVNPQRGLTARITVRIRAGRTTRRAVRLSRTGD
jgi:hypothetical protein